MPNAQGGKVRRRVNGEVSEEGSAAGPHWNVLMVESCGDIAEQSRGCGRICALHGVPEVVDVASGDISIEISPCLGPLPRIHCLCRYFCCAALILPDRKHQESTVDNLWIRRNLGYQPLYRGIRRLMDWGQQDLEICLAHQAVIARSRELESELEPAEVDMKSSHLIDAMPTLGAGWVSRYPQDASRVDTVNGQTSLACPVSGHIAGYGDNVVQSLFIDHACRRVAQGADKGFPYWPTGLGKENPAVQWKLVRYSKD